MRGRMRQPLFLGAVILFAMLIAWPRAATADDCAINPDWKVDGVSLPRAPDRKVTDYVQIGDIIAVQSVDLAALRHCAAMAKKTILLYLDGMPLTGLAEFPLSNAPNNEAWFTLKIDTPDQSTWNALLGRPGIGESRQVTVSLGLAGGYIDSKSTINLRPLPPIGLTLWAVVFIAGVILFFYFAATTSLLRGGTPIGGRAFSIARSQAAWWFFIVVGSYLFIGLTTGNYSTSLNQTALTLLGIAAATHLGSAVVDKSKDTPVQAQAQAQSRAQLQALIDLPAAQPVVAGQPVPAAAPTANPAHVAKLQRLNGESQGWLIDVLSDADGIDFHRFQMLAWTIVLGIIFIINVWQGLAMPDFSATLLGLMGLSAGTYIGLKIPEATT